MNVEWNPKVLKRHQRGEQVGRVKARLTGKVVGEIKLGVPVLTDQQVRQLSALADRFEEMQVEIERQLETLTLALNCLRTYMHPDGWASVRVIGRDEGKDGDLLVARVVHHKADTSKNEPSERFDRKRKQQKLRQFRAGYIARSR